MSQTVVSSQPRLQEIDALRGLAAVAVMVAHYSNRFQNELGGHTNHVVFGFPYGSECVDLFFMISGFVILMTAERCARVRDFAVARAARLFPTYWVSVAVSFGLIHCTGLLPDATTSRIHAAMNLTMLQMSAGIPNLDGVYWSLYVELYFYFVVGVLIAVRRIEWLALILLGLAAVDVLLMIPWLVDSIPGIWRLPRLLPLVDRAEYFCFGVWMFQLRQGWDWRFIPVCFCLWGCSVADGEAISFSINAILFSGAVFGWFPWLANRVLVFAGTISYSLYLLHQNLGYVLIHWLESRGVESNLTVILAMLISIGVASLVCFTIERPANSVIRRWWRKREAPVSAKPVELAVKG